jgi:hypothetical protein
MRKFATLFYVTFYTSNFCIMLTALSMLGFVGQYKIINLTQPPQYILVIKLHAHLQNKKTHLSDLPNAIVGVLELI